MPAGWLVQVRRGRAGLRSTMDPFGGSSLKYVDTRPRPNQFKARLSPVGDLERLMIELFAEYRPVAMSGGGDALQESLRALTAYVKAHDWLTPLSNPERLAGHGGVPAVAVTLRMIDDDELVLHRVRVQRVGSVIFALTVEVEGPTAAMQQFSQGLSLVTGSIEVDWPLPSATGLQRLAGTYRATVGSVSSGHSSGGERRLTFLPDGRFLDQRDTATSFAGSGAAGWARTRGVFGKGRAVVLDGFLILLYDWLQQEDMDRFKAYPLRFTAEGIELDNRPYLRVQ
jgi:hypothetical protein